MKDSETASSVEGGGCLSELHRAVRDKYVNTTITYLLMGGFLYLLTISIFSRHILHPLTGNNDQLSFNMTNNVISIFIIWLAASALGWLLSVVKLPPLFGALLTGIAFKNIPLLSETFQVGEQWQYIIRLSSIACLIIKWGLGLQWKTIKRRPFIPFTIGIFTPIIESGCIALAAHFICGIDVSISILTGFILAPVSSAVTVPVLLDVQKDGRGEEKVVPSLLAATSLDNIFCIIAFTAAVSAVFSSDAPSLTVLHILLQIVVAIISGFCLGFLLWFFPSNTNSDSGVVRSIIIFIAAATTIFGFNAVHWNSSGITASLLLTIVAAASWKTDNDKGTKVQEQVYDSFWRLLFLPLLFSTLGLRLDFDQLTSHKVVSSLILIAIGCVARFFSTLILSSLALSVKESVFAALTMLPKATIQAALGPIIAVYAVSYPYYSQQIDTLMVAAIIVVIITAPIGQLLLQIFAPVLLRRESPKFPTFMFNPYQNGQNPDEKNDIILNGIGNKSFIKADEVSLRF